ncbi:ArsR family transcriptional regulator [Actinoalloteichus hoggarensis]|uniref:HTH-type transcriptional repressor SmtB n=2 Tax=Actinoalloteichus hoggarensis TaxID=1470176 RepID=A0A221W8Q9_9PSEU|nr:metalloregulator ArsR/SmtB family transcription factor [Actinoalloteichus hoggarensis]ASO22093.1 HTH-type transcriptional repressor SmtB [Actinoalloteichus hoggarensis]MBB5923825.1 ArsR family transcriptional regulator [Actinoalloteichus hoggarensis]
MPTADAMRHVPGIEHAARGVALAPDDVRPGSPCDERAASGALPMPAPKTLIAAGDLLRALAAPVRISIVLQLRQAERCVHELVESLGVTQPLISQHLRVLKSAGVVQGTRQGREVVYRLVDEHLAHIVVDAVTHVEEPQPSSGAEDT